MFSYLNSATQFLGRETSFLAALASGLWGVDRK